MTTLVTSSVRDVVCAAAVAELRDRAGGREEYTDLPESIAATEWMNADLAFELVASSSWRVRRALADNQHTPVEVLLLLVEDEEDRVVTSALANPVCLYPVVRDHPDGVDTVHPDCPPDLLAVELTRLRAREDVNPKSAPAAWTVLTHPNLSARVRRRVAPRLTSTNLALLLENPRTTQEEAERIFRLPNGHRSLDALRASWASNPNAAAQWLRRIYNENTDHSPLTRRIASNPATPADVFRHLVRRGTSTERVAANPSCPPAVLVGLCGSWNTFGEVATNPTATLQVLACLDARALRGEGVYQFTSLHASTPAQASVVLALSGTWKGNLADLLRASQSVAA